MHRTRRDHRAKATTATVVLMALTIGSNSPTDASSSPTFRIVAGPTWIDTTSRAAVDAAYKAEYSTPVPKFGFSGDVESCRPGQTSAAHQTRVRDRLNFHRRMAGVADVEIDEDLIAEAQAAALIGAAEGTITHSVSSTARCYSETGAAGAATSSLALGIAGVEAVEAFIDDGVGQMGHRQWMLTSAAHTMATGDVPAGAKTYDSNALTIGLGEERSTRDGFVAWPPSGFVPDELNEKTWTFQLNQADVTNATVAVTISGVAVPVQLIFRGAVYASPTIAFVPAVGTLALDRPYSVQISGVLVGGIPQSFTYHTTFFHIPKKPEGTRLFASVARCGTGKPLWWYPTKSFWTGGEGIIIASVTGEAASRWAIVKGRLVSKGLIPPSRRDEVVEVAVTSDYGWSTTSTAKLAYTGPTRCTTTVASATMKRSSRIELTAFITVSEPGTVRWRATGECRISGEWLVGGRKRGSCLVQKIVTKGRSTWTIARRAIVR